MKKLFFTLAIAIMSLSSNSFGQNASFVDYDAYLKLAKEVQEHRKERVVSSQKFVDLSKEANVIILDTRSEKMYKQKHIKGAINLNFSDFTQETLAKIIPNKDTKILIYCNNNFSDDQINFPTKMYIPPTDLVPSEEEITLALNIPTYINLYGYGYKNVFELGDLISVFNKTIPVEGTAVLK